MTEQFQSEENNHPRHQRNWVKPLLFDNSNNGREMRSIVMDRDVDRRASCAKQPVVGLNLRLSS